MVFPDTFCISLALVTWVYELWQNGFMNSSASSRFAISLLLIEKLSVSVVPYISHSTLQFQYRMSFRISKTKYFSTYISSQDKSHVAECFFDLV